MKNALIAQIAPILGFTPSLEKPKNKALAHYAMPVFALAKEQKLAPNIIATNLAKKLENSELYSVSALGGYVNFKLSAKFLDEIAKSALKEDKNFASKNNSKKEKYYIEYISANPTGPLHIGHVRGAVYGDSLARIARYLGHDVHTEYYINDAGNQIDLLGISVALRAKELLFNENIEYPSKYYRGEYIDEIIIPKALEHFGKEIFYDENRVLELVQFGKDLVLEIIKNDLQDVNISIDEWASEKALYPRLEPVMALLSKSSKMYEKDGAQMIASSELGDDEDRVVVRKDGRPTYLAGDIIYHEYKFHKNYDHYINIWGADHHGYIARIKAGIHFLGYDENKLEVILMQMVNLLKDGAAFKISKRSGTAILMSEISASIGAEALRYIFISKANTSPLEFDIDALKKQDSSNPIFYVNYAHARINQVFAKANISQNDVVFADLSKLDQNAQDLAYEALCLNEILNDALNSRALHKITDYLKALSASFHKFYNENRVLGSDDEKALLKLFALVGLSIRVGLSLLGIKAKERMQNY